MDVFHVEMTPEISITISWIWTSKSTVIYGEPLSWRPPKIPLETRERIFSWMTGWKSCPFYKHGLTLIHAWISNHVLRKVWVWFPINWTKNRWICRYCWICIRAIEVGNNCHISKFVSNKSYYEPRFVWQKYFGTACLIIYGHLSWSPSDVTDVLTVKMK